MAFFSPKYDWLFAIGTIFFCFSLWGIGANDVANSYATSVSSRALTLVQAGCLATVTEFSGSIGLGARVTETIRKGIISPTSFKSDPAVLILAMATAEIGSAVWQYLATRWGFPVSTTQSIVGALAGVGIAANVHVKWEWKSGSLSQVAASWAIAPAIAAGFGAVIFLSIRIFVLDRSNPLKCAMYAIPVYYGITAGILAIFFIVSGGHGLPSPEKLGAGRAVGIVLGCAIGVGLLTAIFFLPYFHRKLVVGDSRLRLYHVFLGPALWKEDVNIPFPGKQGDVVIDYYARRYTEVGDPERPEPEIRTEPTHGEKHPGPDPNASPPNETGSDESPETPLERAEHYFWWHPRRIGPFLYRIIFYGISHDVITHQSKGLRRVHERAPKFDNKTEHLFTMSQIASAIIMSISHGANDVSNAIGPFTTEYQTWSTGEVLSTQPTPIWIAAVGGIGLSVGFWTYGYKIMRALGNKITLITPTRGFAMELGAAITVLLASRLGLPVSTTQCITGGIIGVALVNKDLKSIHWKQLAWIFLGWVLTCPVAGLISGILMGIFLNTPHFLNN